MTPDLDTIEIETGNPPRAAIVLMHGLGADGNDFVPIAGEMDLSAVGPVRFVFPNAPRIPVTINAGCVMPAWYDVHPERGLEDEAPTGLFFDAQTPEAIADAVLRFEACEARFDALACRRNAERFAAQRFRDEFAAHVAARFAAFRARRAA